MAVPISLSHGGKTKQLLLFPGITSQEISETIQSAFDLSEPVLDEEGEETAEQKRFKKRQEFYDKSRHFHDHSSDRDSEDEGELPSDEHMLEYIQNNTAFSSLPMTDILQIFRSAAKQGLIDRRTFEKCFAEVMPPTDGQDAKIVKLVADRLFDIFDRDGNGVVDHAEFVAGLSLLCRASSDDKIKAAFSLFDIDGDGYITYDEMLRYMTSFFEVCFALDATMKKRFGNITAEQVGVATAKHCFERADANGDGRISYEEFTQWCNSDDSVARSGIIPQH